MSHVTAGDIPEVAQLSLDLHGSVTLVEDPKRCVAAMRDPLEPEIARLQ